MSSEYVTKSLPALDGVLLGVAEVDVGRQQDPHRVRVAPVLCGGGRRRRRGHLDRLALSVHPVRFITDTPDWTEYMYFLKFQGLQVAVAITTKHVVTC